MWVTLHHPRKLHWVHEENCSVLGPPTLALPGPNDLACWRRAETNLPRPLFSLHLSAKEEILSLIMLAASSFLIDIRDGGTDLSVSEPTASSHASAAYLTMDGCYSLRRYVHHRRRVLCGRCFRDTFDNSSTSPVLFTPCNLLRLHIFHRLLRDGPHDLPIQLGSTRPYLYPIPLPVSVWFTVSDWERVIDPAHADSSLARPLRSAHFDSSFVTIFPRIETFLPT